VIERADTALVAALHPSPNVEPRRLGPPDILLLHYTGLACVEKAIEVLSRPDCKVSCHYVVDTDGRITQMVAEDLRAWHAGASSWGGETDVNSLSIGIEIQNPGHALGYPDFPVPQMEAVVALSSDIVARHGIARERVLAHSDVAPGRKIDPGEKFDWTQLWRAGVGHWVEPSPIGPDAGFGAGEIDASVGEAQALLSAYGYGISCTGLMDEQTVKVVAAFQRHFRPARVDGRLDRSTCVTLERLVAASGQAQRVARLPGA